MSQYDQPTLTPGKQQTGLTTEESYDNIDPNSATYPESQKKPSILGKLKDKTRKAGSKIKSKVGKKKNPDGTPATPTAGADDEEDEDEDEDDDDSPYSPADAASPAVATTPYTGPASVPREFGTYPTPETDPTPAMSGLSLGSEQAPSATEKASGVSEGAKDAMYGGAAATAGAVGYDAMSRDDEKPVTEKASDMSSYVFGQGDSEQGRGGYNRAGDFADHTTGAAYDAKDTVAEKGSEVADQTTGAAYDAKDTVAEKGSEVADQTTGAAYEAKDAAQSKAADVNNATDDSQTYTEKASNAAFAAKDTVAAKLGLNQPSEGPSVVDKAKGYFGSTMGTTQDTTGAGVDTTKDYATGAKDTTMDTTNSAADTTKGYAATATDTAKAYAGSAYDTTASAAQSVTNTTKDYAAKATGAAAPKQDDKTLSEKITDTLSGLTAPATTPTGAAHDEANPGILGKLTGMLGYPQKTPEAHAPSAADTTTTTTSTTL